MSKASGKVALVTGGASGIGRASAIEFARQGFSAIVIADVDVGGAEGTCSIIKTEFGANAAFFKTDVSEEEDVRALLNGIRSQFGRLDCCHNNAGIEGDRAPTHDYSTETFDRVLAVNVRCVFLCIKHQVPLMLATAGNKGSIVITSSTAGLCCAAAVLMKPVFGMLALRD
eukprot:GHRQ01010915.1.p1 GENE.GHRQ01010915.1~~GHRQ01010915.1.p1  ORF type:complete len:171 (+),score=30.60 GHRQ01010915.1:431-943(+)